MSTRRAWDDIEREFHGGLSTRPERRALGDLPARGRLWELGITSGDVAAFLRDYRYGENIGPYIQDAAIEHDLLDRPQFAAVFATEFLTTLAGTDLSAYGPGIYPEAEIGIPAPLL